MNESNLFKKVIDSKKATKEQKLRLHAKLNNSAFNSTRISYCISGLAAVSFWLLAAPRDVVNNELEIEFRLKRDNVTIWRHQFKLKSNSIVKGYYYNHKADFIGYPQLMQEGMNQTITSLDNFLSSK